MFPRQTQSFPLFMRKRFPDKQNFLGFHVFTVKANSHRADKMRFSQLAGKDLTFCQYDCFSKLLFLLYSLIKCSSGEHNLF